jgi:hypothetical protein
MNAREWLRSANAGRDWLCFAAASQPVEGLTGCPLGSFGMGWRWLRLADAE